MILTRSCRWLARHELLLVALAAPAMLFPGPWTWPAALALALGWVSRRVAWGRFSVATPVDGAAALLLATSLLGLGVSADVAHSLPRFWGLVFGLALLYALANWPAKDRDLRLAGDLLLAGGAGLALLALLGVDWAGVRLLDLPLMGRLPALVRDPSDGALLNPRVMGMALAVLLGPVLAQALWGGGGRRRLLAALVAALMAATLGLTQSLQAALGLAVGLLVLAVGRSRWFLLAVPAGAALAAAAVLAYGPHALAVDLLSVEHPLGIAVTLRLDMWARALAMIGDLPFTGIGLDLFPQIQTGFYPGLLLGPEPHAHSLYLQVALDLGLPGLAALIWLVVALAVGVARCPPELDRPEARAILLGAGAGMGAYLSAGLIDSPWSTKPGVLFWLMAGLALVACRQAGEAWRAGGGWPRFLPLAAIALGVGLSLALCPAAGARNLGAVQAHRALLRAEAGQAVPAARLEGAARHLEASLSRPGNGTLYRTLGRLYGWLEEPQRGVEWLARGAALDGQAPLARYAPWLPWLRRLQGQADGDRWEDLLWVYQHWMVRFPARAEAYVQSAWVWQVQRGDVARAAALLEVGLAAGARPGALLTCSLAEMGEHGE